MLLFSKRATRSSSSISEPQSPLPKGEHSRHHSEPTVWLLLQGALNGPKLEHRKLGLCVLRIPEVKFMMSFGSLRAECCWQVFSYFPRWGRSWEGNLSETSSLSGDGGWSTARPWRLGSDGCGPAWLDGAWSRCDKDSVWTWIQFPHGPQMGTQRRQKGCDRKVPSSNLGWRSSLNSAVRSIFYASKYQMSFGIGTCTLSIWNDWPLGICVQQRILSILW